MLIYRPGELVGAGSRHHTLPSAHKQRVSEACSQPRDGVTEGRLTESYLPCGPADMPLVHQRFKREEEVKINAADIHNMNITHFQYLLLK